MAVRTAVWTQATARVLRQRDGGAGHQWLELSIGRGFEAPEPGQFVQLLLGPAASGALLPRPMSVASCRRTPRGLTLGFLYVPIGLGTRALAALESGDQVEMLGPLGRGFPLAAPGTPVLVAGGRGVAPLLYAAEALARAGRRCEFVFGARRKALLVGLAEARRLLRVLGGRLHLATDDGSAGYRGHAVALVERVSARLEAPLVLHACGPHGMLKALAGWSLARGIPAHLAMESVMACGTGVCRGCPLPRRAHAGNGNGGPGHPEDPAPMPSLFGNRDWALCCTEGPVFEAGALDWERIET